MTKRIIIAGISLFFIWFTVTFLVDTPLADHPDLDWPTRAISNQDNGHAQMVDLWSDPLPRDNFKEAADLLKKSPEDDFSQLSQCNEILKQELNDLDTLLLKPAWQFSDMPSSDLGQDSCATYGLTMVRLLSKNASYHREEGDYRASLKEGLCLLHFGQRLIESEGPIISLLIGSAVFKRGCSEVMQTIAHQSITKSDRDAVKSILLPSLQLYGHTVGSIRYEYQSLSALIRDPALAAGLSSRSGASPFANSSLFYKKNRTQNKLAQHFREVIDFTEKRSFNEFVTLDEPDSRNRIIQFLGGAWRTTANDRPSSARNDPSESARVSYPCRPIARADRVHRICRKARRGTAQPWLPCSRIPL